MNARAVAAGIASVIAFLALAPAWLPVRARQAEQLPQRLVETGLFSGDPDTIASHNRRFVPQYPLWSDGMTKRRWVALPGTANVDAKDAHAWDFPAGTRFWKEFSLNGRKIETRLLWKTSDTEWLFGSYVWNEDGTDATLAPEDGIPAFVEVAPGRRHSIPSRSDCAACHGTKRPGPLGFTALQLSTDRDPNAIHGEPLAPGMLTLRDLVEQRILSPARHDLVDTPPRIRTANPSTRAALGYLAANCGSCHNGNADLSVLGPSLTTQDLIADADAVARAFIDRESRWQVPGTTDGRSVLLRPGVPEESAMLVRMRSRAPSSQMPPIGTVLRDREAVDAIGRWIAGLR
jgi:mono/diheme cytochrome c family protein